MDETHGEAFAQLEEATISAVTGGYGERATDG